jgi:hypothetical protein
VSWRSGRRSLVVTAGGWGEYPENDQRSTQWRYTVTFLWFVVWFIANNIGGSAPLQFDPVNFWAGALLLAIAIDLNRPRPEFGMAKRKPMAQRREAL